ncbi:hypothetical protein [Coraliomargarita parva]|nr:hypothetical protein [Coraliomargarita parva]
MELIASGDSAERSEVLESERSIHPKGEAEGESSMHSCRARMT